MFAFHPITAVIVLAAAFDPLRTLSAYAKPPLMKRALATAGKVLLVIVALPLAAIAGLLSSVFGLREKRTAGAEPTISHEAAPRSPGQVSGSIFMCRFT